MTAPGQSPIRLVALDLDGTLLDTRSRLPEANLAAVEAAIARGVHVVVVTGRSYHFAAPITQNLPQAVTLILNNGAAVKSWDGRAIASRPLPRAVAATVIAAAGDHRADAGLVFDRSGPRQVVFESIDLGHPSRKAYFERHREVVGESRPLESALDEDPLALVFNGAGARMRALHERLATLARATPLALAVTDYPARDFTLVDVMAAGTSKGRTLAAWAATCGITPGEALAIGDNYNDMDMLEWAGTGVVMGNAAPDLRARGWHVTSGNDAAGVAAAIDAFVLGATRPPPRP